jgi:hypothetical protein
MVATICNVDPAGLWTSRIVEYLEKKKKRCTNEQKVNQGLS